MNTADTWNSLEAGTPGGGGGYLTRRIHPEAAADLLLAVEKPSNTRLLVLRVSNTPLKPGGDLPRAEGFEVRRGFETVDGKKQFHLAVRLTHPGFADVFTALVDDVVAHVVRATGEAAAVRALVDRLERWQAFLKRHPADGLGEELQQGLYGELWFLGRHAVPRLGPRAAVSSWKGPGGAAQDFQLPALAVEVKTASGKQHQKLAISNERQLDPIGVGHLLVFHLSLDVRRGGGETLPARVFLTRELIKPDAVAAAELENLLFEAGYLDCHAPAYDACGYTVRESNFFEVRDGFPRIVEADLRNGVGDVRYTVSVAECKNYAFPEAQVHLLLKVADDGN
jgi:Putative  PD-(D/E)XK family member, (DUF4420)